MEALACHSLLALSLRSCGGLGVSCPELHILVVCVLSAMSMMLREAIASATLTFPPHVRVTTFARRPQPILEVRSPSLSFSPSHSGNWEVFLPGITVMESSVQHSVTSAKYIFHLIAENGDSVTRLGLYVYTPSGVNLERDAQPTMYSFGQSRSPYKLFHVSCKISNR